MSENGAPQQHEEAQSEEPREQPGQNETGDPHRGRENLNLGIAIAAVFIAAIALIPSCQANRIARAATDLAKESNTTAKNALLEAETANRIASNSLGEARTANEIAAKALTAAEKANAIASNVVRVSETQFIQINRPYILVNPERNKADKFLALKREGKRISVQASYEMKNVGNVTAQDISLPKKGATPHKFPPGAKMLLPNTVSLGPGDNHHMAVALQVEFPTEEKAITAEKEFVSGDQFLEFSFGVSYKNANDQGRTYETARHDRISVEKVIVIDSQLFDLRPPAN